MTSTTPDLDLGSRRIPGWYWMQSGNRREPYLPRADAAAGELRPCFSYERSEPSIKEAALNLIENAKEKIFLASFRFVDDDLREALRRAAERLQGGVYVVISIDDDKDLRDTLDFAVSYEEDEEEDWYDETDPTATANDINEQENKKHYSDLCASGVWVRGHPSFHAKFLVVDDCKALVSSANLESTALSDAFDRPGRAPGFDAVTGECGVVSTRPADTELLGRFFARLWYAECTWDAPPSDHYKLGPRSTVPAWFTVARTPLGAAGPIWTGSGDRLILEAIHEISALARNDLVLATFSAKGLEEHHDLLFDPVRAALDRGVRVRLLLRSRNYDRGQDVSDPELTEGRRGGGPVHACRAAAGQPPGQVAQLGGIGKSQLDANGVLASGIACSVHGRSLPSNVRAFALSAILSLSGPTGTRASRGSWDGIAEPDADRGDVDEGRQYRLGSATEHPEMRALLTQLLMGPAAQVRRLLEHVHRSAHHGR